MAISSGQRLILLKSADGKEIVLPVTAAKTSGDRAILLKTADGFETPIQCKAMTKSGQRGTLIKTADGVLVPIVFDIQEPLNRLIHCTTTNIYVEGLFGANVRSWSSSFTSGLTFDTDNENLISATVQSGSRKIFIHAGLTSTVSSSFAAPTNNIGSLAFDSSTGNLLSAEDYGGTGNKGLLRIHDGVSSTILSSFDLPGENVNGITYDSKNGNLISSGHNPNKIYIHSGVTSSVSSSFTPPSGSPYGLAFDGTNLASTYSISPYKAYFHDGVTSTIDRTVAISNNPRGLTIGFE